MCEWRSSTIECPLLSIHHKLSLYALKYALSSKTNDFDAETQKNQRATATKNTFVTFKFKRWYDVG